MRNPAPSAFLFAACCLAGATTKGLNQIVTPDIQALGQLSVSFQAQHQFIGNPYQLQYELGITKQFELAAFEGLRPGIEVLSAEYGLVQSKNWLLSTGFSGWSTRGDQPTPFIEGGYYKGKVRATAGLQRTGSKNYSVAGFAYSVNDSLLLQFDYLSGQQNFTTAGFTYNLTPNLQINPALYMANSPDRKLYPYVVITWSITAWKA